MKWKRGLGVLLAAVLLAQPLVSAASEPGTTYSESGISLPGGNTIKLGAELAEEGGAWREMTTSFTAEIKGAVGNVSLLNEAGDELGKEQVGQDGMVTFTLSNATPGGTYRLRTDSGVEEELTLLENVVYGRKAETPMKGQDGQVIDNLTDGTIKDWNAMLPLPSDEAPQSYTIKLDGKKEISGFSVWCGLGQNHGIKRAYFQYMNEAGVWENVKGPDGETEFTFAWEDMQGNTRIPAHIDFQPVQTEQARLVVLESANEWGDNSVMSELQVWGTEAEGEEEEPVDIDSSISPDLIFKGDGEIEKLQDANTDTVWNGNTGEDNKAEIEIAADRGETGSGLIAADEVWLVSDSPEIKRVKLLADCNENGHYALVNENSETVSWKEQDGKWVGRIPMDAEQFITGNMKLELLAESAGKDVSLAEILVMGYVLESNPLTARADVQVNGTSINTAGMSANTLSATSTAPVAEGSSNEVVIDFGQIPARVDGFLYAVNFPTEQGFTGLDLQYREDSSGEWQTIAEDLTPDWHVYSQENNKQLRQAFDFSFEPVTAAQMKFVLHGCPAVWGQVVFEELNIFGQDQMSAEIIASHLEVTQPEVGEEKLKMPAVLEGWEDKYSVAIETSSDTDFLELDGTLHPGEESKDVQVTFRVTNVEDSQDTAVSEEYTIHIFAQGMMVISPVEDSETFLNNPASGWVQYVEGFECRTHWYDETGKYSGLCTTDPKDIEEFWAQIDELREQGLCPSILYMRMQWSWFEPEDDVYAWDDPESELSRLVAGARERGIQLAFRVLIDSMDIGEFQAAPVWLTDDLGAQCETNTYVVNGEEKTFKTPYINDPVFLDKYVEFIEAFGNEFDTEDVAYIDTVGAGNWGEMNNIRFKAGINEKVTSVGQAVSILTDAYDRAFENVILGLQYGSNGGSFDSWVSERDFAVRRDSFGSPRWLPDAEIETIAGLVEDGHPLFAENCYHHFVTRNYRWSSEIDQKEGVSDSFGDDVYKTMEEMMQGVMDHALRSRANTLDIRVLEDAHMWVQARENGYDFIQEGVEDLGYRMSAVRFAVPATADQGETIEIGHTWKNSGVGILPNSNKKWNNKYKVSFALIDPKTGEIAYQFVEDVNKVNPGDWKKEGGNYTYASSLQIPGEIADGSYQLCVGIVNEKMDNQPQIKLANTMEKNGDWYVIDEIKIGQAEDIDDGNDPSEPGKDDPGTTDGKDDPGTTDEKADQEAARTDRREAAKTGDNSSLMLWLVLLGTGCVAITGRLRKKLDYN